MLIVMTRLRLISLDDTVVFPGMAATLPVDVGGETRVLLVSRRGSVYAKVGVVAEVSEWRSRSWDSTGAYRVRPTPTRTATSAWTSMTVRTWCRRRS
jgi:hypothetical protein